MVLDVVGLFTKEHQMHGLKLVLVIIISLALFLTVGLSYISSRAYANDQIRIRDVELLQKFLTAYKDNEGGYPVAASSLPTGWERYLERLPQSPAAGGSCTVAQNKYSYRVMDSGLNYSLSFCLAKGVGDFPSGVNTVGPK